MAASEYSRLWGTDRDSSGIVGGVDVDSIICAFARM